MPDIISYVIKNKEWIFSGIGVLLLSILFWLFRQVPQSFSRRISNRKQGIASSEHLELDREIYKKIRQMLPWNGSVRFIREYSFDGLSFSIHQFSDLYQFCDECQNPNFEFIDTDLEGIRVNLLEKIQQFLEVIAHETFPEGTSDVNRIPWEWRVEQPEHFERVVGQLNKLASQIGEYYDSLGRIGRRRLGVE